MAARGITIDAITIQNEPQHGGNNPSMVMSSTQQADFIKNHLGPAFQSAGISTKIIVRLAIPSSDKTFQQDQHHYPFD